MPTQAPTPLAPRDQRLVPCLDAAYLQSHEPVLVDEREGANGTAFVTATSDALVIDVVWPLNITNSTELIRVYNYFSPPFTSAVDDYVFFTGTDVRTVYDYASARAGENTFVFATFQRAAGSGRYLIFYALFKNTTSTDQSGLINLGGYVFTEQCANTSLPPDGYVEVQCNYALRTDGQTGTYANQECYAFLVQCAELSVYRMTGASAIGDNLSVLSQESCTVTNNTYDLTDVVSLSASASNFPADSGDDLLAYVLMARDGDEHCDWLLARLTCTVDRLSANDTLLFDRIEIFPRSALASYDSGDIVVRTQLHSVDALGDDQIYVLIPSAVHGRAVEFFNPFNRSATLRTWHTGAASYIYRSSASKTDYRARGTDVLFAVSFYEPEQRLFIGAGAVDEPWAGGVLRSSFYTNPNASFAYDANNDSLRSNIRRFSLGTEFEYANESTNECNLLDPVLAVITQPDDVGRVLRVRFDDNYAASAINVPTGAPTPSPTSVAEFESDPWPSQLPLRTRAQLPLPNSVLTVNLMHVACENNTWVRPESVRHCDACDPYSTVARNNDTHPLWYIFETADVPAAYQIYTDPAGKSCTRRDCNHGTPYASVPLEATVVSQWESCAQARASANSSLVEPYQYSLALLHSSCSNTSEPGLAEEHSHLGVLCFPYSTVEHVRVRGKDPLLDVGDFDVTVEEWFLRRGGDTCREAHALDSGASDLNCAAAVYTNLCAPSAGADLHRACAIDGVLGSHTPTTWFSYETRADGALALHALDFQVYLNDSLSLSGSSPFSQPQNFSVTLSLWRACETILQAPLFCTSFNVSIDLNGDPQVTPEFLHGLFNETNPNAPYDERMLKPHTVYYLAVSTAYVGDYALCVREVADEPCRERGNPGTCDALCADMPCDSLQSLDSKLIVESFARPPHAAGATGSALSDLLRGVDITARGRSCNCCRRPMLFDTENVTGDECELGTPNARFSGPGCGLGGAEGHGVNLTPLGLCILVSEDEDAVDVDGERDEDIVLRFDFCGEVLIEYMVFINARDGTEVTLFDYALEDYPALPVRDTGANGVYNLTINNPAYAPPLVKRVDVLLRGDAAGTNRRGAICIAEFAYRVRHLNDICECSAAPDVDIAHPSTRGAGACCYDNGKQCADFDGIEPCDLLLGDYVVGESCATSATCPHTKVRGGGVFGWQQDSRHPFENERHLRRKYRGPDALGFGYAHVKDYFEESRSVKKQKSSSSSSSSFSSDSFTSEEFSELFDDNKR